VQLHVLLPVGQFGTGYRQDQSSAGAQRERAAGSCDQSRDDDSEGNAPHAGAATSCRLCRGDGEQLTDDRTDPQPDQEEQADVDDRAALVASELLVYGCPPQPDDGRAAAVKSTVGFSFSAAPVWKNSNAWNPNGTTSRVLGNDWIAVLKSRALVL
jgi:hypothetical protein